MDRMTWYSKRYFYNNLPTLYYEWDHHSPKDADYQLEITKKTSQGSYRKTAVIEMGMNVAFIAAYVDEWAHENNLDPNDYLYKICETI